MYEVYISKSLKDLRTYTGYSRDAQERLEEHNLGKVNATKNRRPLEIIYIERVFILKEAEMRELYWKSGAGRRRLKHFFEEGFPPGPENLGGRGSLK